MKRSDLKFHDTFQPDASYISQILCLSAEEYSGSKHDISALTGIPTGNQRGKVEPSIRYAAFMGLIRYEIEDGIYHLHLTKIGEAVFEQDRYLHEQLTRWICHYGITSAGRGAPQWQFIVNKLELTFNSSISSDYIAKAANIEWGLDLKFSELFGVVRSSYKDGFFESLKYIQWDDSLRFIEHRATFEMAYLYAYVLLRQWEFAYPDVAELTETALFEELKFCHIFSMNSDEARIAFDLVEKLGLVRINRQLYPVIYLRNASSDATIANLYDNLL